LKAQANLEGRHQLRSSRSPIGDRSPILNRNVKADLFCSPINGRHQRGSRRQMAACPRPARLGSCGGRRPAV